MSDLTFNLSSLKAHTTSLLTIYHRIDSEQRSQSENSVRDRTLVDLYSSPLVRQFPVQTVYQNFGRNVKTALPIVAVSKIAFKLN